MTPLHLLPCLALLPLLNPIPNRSMHVLGNIANLVLYFSSPPSHMANFRAAAACVAASAAAAACTGRFVSSKK